MQRFGCKDDFQQNQDLQHHFQGGMEIGQRHKILREGHEESSATCDQVSKTNKNLSQLDNTLNNDQSLPVSPKILPLRLH